MKGCRDLFGSRRAHRQALLCRGWAAQQHSNMDPNETSATIRDGDRSGQFGCTRDCMPRA